jgi:hypothetical protein
MKLTTVTAMLKSNAVKLLAGAALAGAVLTAVPAAQAQRVVFGVQFGGPRYYAPPPVVYDRPGYYDNYRHFDGWRNRDDFRFHSDWRDRRDWERHDFGRRNFNHGRDFDHR